MPAVCSFPQQTQTTPRPFSVNNYRYTRWTPIDAENPPFKMNWTDVWSEELYDHSQDVGNDFDNDELHNLAYDPAHASTLAALRAILQAEFDV